VKAGEVEILDCDRMNIYELTKKLITKTRCIVSVQLCARVAIMVRIPSQFQAGFTLTLLLKRLVIKKHPGDNFWDKVDTKLDDIRKKADNNKEKIKRSAILLCGDIPSWLNCLMISRAMRHCLDKDRETYGMLDQDDIKDGEPNDWLDDIDDAVAKANGDAEK